MTGWQRHPSDLGGIPGAHDQAPALRIFSELREDVVDLVDVRTVRALPIAPLRAVDATKIAFSVGPLIPYRDAVFVEVAHIGVAAQKPEQLVDDRFQMELLRGKQRKFLSQIESRLSAENRKCSRAGA